MTISQKWILLIIGLVIFVISISGCSPEKNFEISLHAPKLILSTSTADEAENAIILAFSEATQNRKDVLAFLIFDIAIDHIDLSETGEYALIWYSLSDPETSEIISGEPGLAIAEKAIDIDGQKSWQVTLQADGNWEQILAEIPGDLLDEEARARYQNKAQALPHARQTFSGYRLPWAPGEAKYLTGSIGHVYLYKTCPSSCLYAFDFADGGMWPVLAAKGGRVRMAVWHYPNGNSKHANYIVIEDLTTSPVTYQVYVHLAQNSIPEALRRPGTIVVQGQKIGVADDTGASTGHHLHFHVHTNPGAYWGNSVDITFDDVDINGGRPRTCYEAKLFPTLGKYCRSGNSYISGNNDYKLPTGGINYPADGELIQKQFLVVKSWAKDDSGIQSAQVMVNFEGNWISVEQSGFEQTGETSIDLCELGIPNGDFYIALDITDKAGKKAEGLPGLTRLTKQFKCPLPQPQCEVNVDQIALFEKADFQGNCVIFDKGNHENFKLLEKQIMQINSIKIGDEVYANLHSQEKIVPILQDAALLSEHFIETYRLTQIEIIEKPKYPSLPTLELYTGSNGQVGEITHLDRIVVYWENNDPTLAFQGTLTNGKDTIAVMEWTKEQQWMLPPLSPGKYHLLIKAQNIMGEAQNEITFTVNEADLPPVTELEKLPIENETTIITLRWRVLEHQNDLQSVEILYRENNGDWIIFGAFPPQVKEAIFYGIPGSQYQFGIRGIDLLGNIEELHTNEQTSIRISEGCGADQYDSQLYNDNRADLANPIELNEAQMHNFCPEGDQDWFVFVGEKDTVYRIIVTPSLPGIGANIKLYTMNGSQPAAVVFAQEPKLDTKLVWSAPKDGIYYLQITPHNEALSGTKTNYSIVMQTVAQFYTPSVIMTSIIIPLLWGLLRLRKQLFRKSSKT